jgi:hypothetical protein
MHPWHSVDSRVYTVACYYLRYFDIFDYFTIFDFFTTWRGSPTRC